MKKAFIFITMLMLPAIRITAQKNDSTTHKIKLQELCLGISLGSLHNTATFGRDAEVYTMFVLSNQWGGSVGYIGTNRASKETPDDYNLFTSSKPIKDINTSYYIRLVKEFSMHFKRLKFGIEAGPAWVRYDRAHFKFDTTNAPSPILYRYKQTYTSENAIGLVFRAKIEFPLLRFLGLEFAAASAINKYNSFVTAEIGIIAGKLR